MQTPQGPGQLRGEGSHKLSSSCGSTDSTKSPHHKTILIPIPIGKSVRPSFRNERGGSQPGIERLNIRDTPEKEEPQDVQMGTERSPTCGRVVQHSETEMEQTHHYDLLLLVVSTRMMSRSISWLRPSTCCDNERERSAAHQRLDDGVACQ
uniref:Uncharacterized protein n=1 Tax=Knipowitschia caucasica TaxID=637954 RepID=A0AAV2LA65_KNICA